MVPLLQLPLPQMGQTSTCSPASLCEGRSRDPHPFAVVLKSNRNGGAVAVVVAAVAGMDNQGRIFVVT